MRLGLSIIEQEGTEGTEPSSNQIHPLCCLRYLLFNKDNGNGRK